MSIESEFSAVDREAGADRCIHFRFLGSVFVGRNRTIGVFSYTEEVRATIEAALASCGLECEFAEGDRPADRESVGPRKGW